MSSILQWACGSRRIKGMKDCIFSCVLKLQFPELPNSGLYQQLSGRFQALDIGVVLLLNPFYSVKYKFMCIAATGISGSPAHNYSALFWLWTSKPNFAYIHLPYLCISYSTQRKHGGHRSKEAHNTFYWTTHLFVDQCTNCFPGKIYTQVFMEHSYLTFLWQILRVVWVLVVISFQFSNHLGEENNRHL